LGVFDFNSVSFGVRVFFWLSNHELLFDILVVFDLDSSAFIFFFGIVGGSFFGFEDCFDPVVKSELSVEDTFFGVCNNKETFIDAD